MNLKLKVYQQPLPIITKEFSAEEILKPQNRFLQSLECERILVILNDAIKNCELIALFDGIMNNLEDYSFFLGSKIYMLFLQFQPHYLKFMDYSRKILAVKDPNLTCLDTETEAIEEAAKVPDDFWTTPIENLKKLPKPKIPRDIQSYTDEELDEFKNSLNEMEAELKRMTPVIQHYTKSILFAFRQNPIISQTVIRNRKIWGIKRNVALVNLIDFMNQLREILNIRLLTTPQERDEKARFLAYISIKEANHQRIIKELKSILDQLKIEKERLVCQMNTDITNLQREMYKLEIKAKNEINRLQKKSEREMKKSSKTHEEMKKKLQVEISELRSQLDELMEKNKEIEITIRRRKWKLENECENWVNKYDNEMSDYQNQYDKLKAEYEEDQRVLEDLQKKFEPLEKEYKQVLEERKKEQDKEDEEKRAKEAIIYWATVIQSFWRAWKTRKMLKKKRRR